MNKRQLVSIISAAAVLTAPVAAFAQQQPYGWSQNANAQVGDRDFYAAVRALDLRPDQRTQIRQLERSGSGQDVRRQIVAVLDQNQRRDLFNRLRAENGNGYGNNGNGNGYGNNGNNGNGNYGNGNGRGDRDDNGNRNDGNRNDGNRNNGNGYGYGQYGDRQGGMRGNQVSGVIASFSGYNLQLRNGTAVSLHQGTVINPTGTSLAPGMRVAIRGSRNSAGGFNADRIDVINR